MEMLSFDDVMCKKPAEMHGDLHITSDGFYFLAFRKVNTWVMALQVNLGLLGMWLAHRSEKRRKLEMDQWRQAHGGRHVDELVAELDGSWIVLKEEIKLIKPRFASQGLVIVHIDNRKFPVQTKKDQWKQIEEFARLQNWPVK
ncbi:MAG: hypothetical protein OEW48_04325 [Phycisphaerae bacterium]|nr:hypothetical protein [Phycisphaerae bacterium]